MNDTKKAEEKVVETETTQVAPPTTESPITGDETTQESSPDQGSVVEESNEPVMQTEEERRAFQEMRLENKRLREEVAARGKSESAFNLFRTPTPPVSEIGPIKVENYQDPVTGLTDWTAYNRDQQVREQQILQSAKAEARNEVQELLDEEKARSTYPDLFNDPVTEKQIASRWLYEKVQGNKVSISDIAGEFARNFKQAVSKAEKLGAERVLNEVTEKEKAGLSAQTQSSQSGAVSSQEDLAQLSVRTRGGDDEAITARISKIPWANK